MRRFAIAAVLALMPVVALADANVTGELDKDYMKFYCLYESHLYSVGSDMCSADGHVQICVYDDKQSARPIWKTGSQSCASTDE